MTPAPIRGAGNPITPTVTREAVGVKILSIKTLNKPTKIIFLACLLLTISGGIVYLLFPKPAKIITSDVTNIPAKGSVVSSQPANPNHLQASGGSKVTYESQPVTINTSANAAILQWKQDGEKGATTEVRTYNGSAWSPWVETDRINTEGGKDGTEDNAKSSTLVIASSIKKIQFRHSFEGTSTAPSATVDAASTTLQTIDSSQGPDPTRLSFWDRVAALFNLNDAAHSKADGTRIVSRAEWGSPEPDWSSWPPEYEPLQQAIVHHTVTTETPYASAAIRAIWHYHAVTLGWGDIGYNYIVDSAGNIFQGRYYDHNYAETNNVEVVAGHAYGHNRGTTGIAALGDFSTNDATPIQKEAMSNIIGFKLAPFDVWPSGSGAFGTSVVGHRDVYPTACPGDILYGQLPALRARASQYYAQYIAEHKLDYTYYNQTIRKNGAIVNAAAVFQPYDDIELSFRIKNNGSETWRNYEPYPTILGTSNPQDRASVFYDPSSWLGPNRATSFSAKYDPSTDQETPATVIAKGEIAVFKIKLSIPDSISEGELSSQLYNEYFRPVQDGRIWFPRDLGLFHPVYVEKHHYHWQYLSQGLYTDSSKTTQAPVHLASNTRYYASLSLKNTGNATWYQQSFHLGTSHPQNRSSSVFDSTWLAPNRPAALQQTTVTPGDTGTMEFWIQTPATPIDQQEYFQPVVERITWLQDFGLYWLIQS